MLSLAKIAMETSISPFAYYELRYGDHVGRIRLRACSGKPCTLEALAEPAKYALARANADVAALGECGELVKHAVFAQSVSDYLSTRADVAFDSFVPLH